MNTTIENKKANSVKTYVCGLCGTEIDTYTNHFGEIYTPCKKCGNGILYCKGNEPAKGLETKLTVYRYNIENHEEAKAYKALKNELKAKGFKLFDSISSVKYGYFDNLRTHETALLNTDSIFDNQWVSNLGRLHDWYEEIYQNKKIKEGYYLTLTPDHYKLREPKKYSIKTYYKGQLIGDDIFEGINTSEISNKAYNKYTPNIPDFDIWSYKNDIELI
jgi:hypothetical protein